VLKFVAKFCSLNKVSLQNFDKFGMISPKFILGLLVFIIFIHALATINNWYWTYNWIDMPMHFLGGFWLGVIFLYFIMPKLEITDHKLLITMILVVSFAVLIGVLWEFFEFLSDIFLAGKGIFEISQQGTGDTMSDLFFDLLGGFIAFIIYRFQLKKNNLPL